MASTTASSSNNVRLTGMVKWFNNKSGFGFLTVCGENQYTGKDIFVHYSNIRITHSQYKYLVLGEYVEFVVEKSDNEKHEYHATDITGIFGGPIMCETRRQALASQSDRKSIHYNNEVEEEPVLEMEEQKPARTRAPRTNRKVDTTAVGQTAAPKRTYKPRKTAVQSTA
jgi:cold shock CspA family protein